MFIIRGVLSIKKITNIQLNQLFHTLFGKVKSKKLRLFRIQIIIIIIQIRRIRRILQSIFIQLAFQLQKTNTLYVLQVEFDCCRSVTQSCPTLCSAMDCSGQASLSLTIPEFAQVHVHCIGDTVQPSHPLIPSSPLPSIFPSISDFSNESSVHII